MSTTRRTIAAATTAGSAGVLALATFGPWFAASSILRSESVAGFNTPDGKLALEAAGLAFLFALGGFGSRWSLLPAGAVLGLLGWGLYGDAGNLPAGNALWSTQLGWGLVLAIAACVVGTAAAAYGVFDGGGRPGLGWLRGAPAAHEPIVVNPRRKGR